MVHVPTVEPVNRKEIRLFYRNAKVAKKQPGVNKTNPRFKNRGVARNEAITGPYPNFFSRFVPSCGVPEPQPAPLMWRPLTGVIDISPPLRYFSNCPNIAFKLPIPIEHHGNGEYGIVHQQAVTVNARALF